MRSYVVKGTFMTRAPVVAENGGAHWVGSGSSNVARLVLVGCGLDDGPKPLGMGVCWRMACMRVCSTRCRSRSAALGVTLQPYKTHTP